MVFYRYIIYIYIKENRVCLLWHEGNEWLRKQLWFQRKRLVSLFPCTACLDGRGRCTIPSCLSHPFDHMPNYSIPPIKIEVDLKLFYNILHTQEYLGTSRAKDEGSTRLRTITANTHEGQRCAWKVLMAGAIFNLSSNHLN